MSHISMMEAKLPPGFRFHPRDEELICDYLMKKAASHHHQELFDSPLLLEVDLNKCEPWDLPELACVGGKEWYFYSQRDRKYATGVRTNRATATGYWKATGKDKPIHRRGVVGMRKTLVFYQGRAPKGTKTDWVMHEFRLHPPFAPPKISSINKEDWVLCRVLYKNKEAAAKASYDTTMSSLSSSLPPLTDSYINFNNIGDYDQQEQVPCFSILSSSAHHNSPNNNIFSSSHEFMDHQLMASDHVSFGGGAMVGMSGGADPFSGNKKVLRTVLDHYFKMESDIDVGGSGGAMNGSPTSLGGGDGSSESFLSEVGMPNMLNLY